MSELLNKAQNGFPDKLVKFWNAARDGSLSEVRKYIDKGGDINLKDNMENTALMLAATNNNIEVIKLLVSHGADINASNFMGATAIELAKATHHTKVVEMLENPSEFRKAASSEVGEKKWWQFWVKEPSKDVKETSNAYTLTSKDKEILSYIGVNLLLTYPYGIDRIVKEIKEMFGINDSKAKWLVEQSVNAMKETGNIHD